MLANGTLLQKTCAWLTVGHDNIAPVSSDAWPLKLGAIFPLTGAILIANGFYFQERLLHGVAEAKLTTNGGTIG